MSKESNIDKLFRNSLKDKNYAYNEASWGNMESMLDAETRKKSWFRRFGVAASLLLLVATSTGLWYSLQTNTSSVSSQIAEATKPFQTENALKPFPKNAPSNSKTELKNTTVSDNTSTKEEKSIDKMERKNNTSNSLTKKSISNRKSLAFTPLNKKLATSLFSTNNLIAQVGFEKRKITDVSFAPHEDSKKLAITPIEKRKYNNYETEEEYIEIEEKASPTDPVDASQIVNNQHSLAFSLGNTFNHGYSNNSGIFGNNIINSIGIEYNYQLNNKLIIGSALLYKSKTGNSLTHTYSEEQYGFGKTTTETSINVNSLHYVEIPLFVDFQIGQKHHVIGGASFGYLTGVRNRVGETKTETLAGTQTNYTNQWGMKEYFNSVDIGLKMAYEYELTKNIKAGVNTQFGLLDITNNSKWGNTEKFNNTEIQFTLKYNFLRF